jgi:hypothetical protein
MFPDAEALLPDAEALLPDSSPAVALQPELDLNPVGVRESQGLGESDVGNRGRAGAKRGRRSLWRGAMIAQ